MSTFHDVGITTLRKSEARSLTTEANMIIPSDLILPAVDATYQNLHVTPFADVLPSTSLRPVPTRWTAIPDVIKSARYSLQCCPVWVPVAILPCYHVNRRSLKDTEPTTIPPWKVPLAVRKRSMRSRRAHMRERWPSLPSRLSRAPNIFKSYDVAVLSKGAPWRSVVFFRACHHRRLNSPSL